MLHLPHVLRARRKPADGLVLRLEWRADLGTGRRPHVGVASALILSAAVGFTGCDGGRSTLGFVGGTAVTVRDSAGVEIVENHEPEHPPGAFWTLGEEPEFVLGGAGSDIGANIWKVRDIARLADGRIAILSQGNHQVFLYEPSGLLSKVIGGRGRGPGEFVRPERMQYLPPDTLAVSDYSMGPVTYFDTAGTVLRTRPIDLARTLDLLPERSAEHPRTPLPDGSFVVAAWQHDPQFERPREGEVYRYPSVEFLRIDSLYTARSLGVWDGLEWWSVPKTVQEMSATASPETQTFHLLDSHVAVGGGSSVHLHHQRGSERDPPVLGRRFSRPHHPPHHPSRSGDGASGSSVEAANDFACNVPWPRLLEAVCGVAAPKGQLARGGYPGRGHQGPFMGKGVVRFGVGRARPVECVQPAGAVAWGLGWLVRSFPVPLALRALLDR